MIQKYRLSALMSLLVLFSLVLAACGGGAATPTNSNTGTNPTTAPTTAATTAPTTSTDTATVEPTTEATTEATETSGGPTGEAEDHVLRVHIPTYPEDLDPHHLSFTHEIAVIGQLYEGLTKLNDELEIVPAAADSWEFNDDLTTITFTLKPDLKYSDGSPLTAENFEYAVRRTLSSEVAGDYQYILFDIVGAAELASTPVTETAALEAASEALGVRVVDDQTIAFDLVQPAPYFPSVASLWVFYPAKQELIEAGGETWYADPENQVGNGPFILTSAEQDQLMTFEPNPNYEGGTPKLERLEYVFISDLSVAFEAFKQGQLDIAQPDPGQIPAIQQDTTLAPQMVAYPQAATTNMAFNLTKPPFDDPKVREAFAYAFDRETYCNVIRNGDCVATLSWVPAGIMGFYEEDRFAFDAEAAKAALAESTYGGADALPPIKYSFSSNNPANRGRAEWIVENYRNNLGVEIELEPLENTVLVSMRKDISTFPQMTLAGWIGDYPDPQNWLSVNWMCTSDQAKQVGYCNEELDALLRQADTSDDPEERERLYVEAGKLLVADQPGVFLYNSANVFLVNPNVTGYATTASDSEWPGQWTSATTIDVTR